MAMLRFGGRASRAELDRWHLLCDYKGIPFGTWARRALNQVCDLEMALVRQEVRERGEADSGSA